jgi:hypothetical protein
VPGGFGRLGNSRFVAVHEAEALAKAATLVRNELP